MKEIFLNLLNVTFLTIFFIWFLFIEFMWYIDKKVRDETEDEKQRERMLIQIKNACKYISIMVLFVWIIVMVSEIITSTQTNSFCKASTTPNIQEDNENSTDVQKSNIMKAIVKKEDAGTTPEDIDTFREIANETKNEIKKDSGK